MIGLRISIIYICLVFVGTILSGKIKYSKTQRKIFLYLFALAMATIAYNIEYDQSWDLSRHFMLMDQIRSSDIGFLSFLFHNTRGIGGSGYTICVFFNMLRYIICHMTSNNRWLPFLCTYGVYAIISYILIDWSETHNINGRIGFFSLLLSLTFMPAVHVISGMRNALGMAIAGLSIYLYLYKNKGVKISIVLMILSITTHPSTILLVPFAILAKLKLKIKGLILILMGSFFALSVISYFSNPNAMFGNDFLYRISKQYIAYFSTDFDVRADSYAYIYYMDMIFILFFLLRFIASIFQKKRKDFTLEETELEYFLIYLMGFVLCNCNVRDIVLRFSYIFSIFSPVVVRLVRNDHIETKEKFLFALTKTVCMCGSLYVFLQNTVWIAVGIMRALQ